MRRTFLLFAAATVISGWMLADAHSAYAGSGRAHHRARHGALRTDDVGKYIRYRLHGSDWGPGYAPHGWFGVDPTRYSAGRTGACPGVAGPDSCFTYTPGFGTQRQPMPLLW
jgi:hypothetical protein